MLEYGWVPPLPSNAVPELRSIVFCQLNPARNVRLLLFIPAFETDHKRVIVGTSVGTGKGELGWTRGRGLRRSVFVRSAPGP